MGKRIYGTVDRLPSGRWRARFRGPDGKRRAAPLTFTTKADATRWLARTEADISRGVWLDPTTGDVTLRTYAEAWLPQRTVKGAPLAPRTRGSYRHSLDAWILPRLGDHKLKALTPAVVRTWHAWLLTQTGPTAARQAYALLRAILNTAVADDAIPRNPCRVPGAGQPNSPERPLLDLDTVEALIAAMPAHLRPLVTVKFWASLRLGEVIALERRDVDLVAGTLRVERQRVEHENRSVEAPPKAASRRTVHLPERALTVLRAWVEARPRPADRAAVHPALRRAAPAPPRPDRLDDRPRQGARGGAGAPARPAARQPHPHRPARGHPGRAHAPRRTRLDARRGDLPARRGQSGP